MEKWQWETGETAHELLLWKDKKLGESVCAEELHLLGGDRAPALPAAPLLCLALPGQRGHLVPLQWPGGSSSGRDLLLELGWGEHPQTLGWAEIPVLPSSAPPSSQSAVRALRARPGPPPPLRGEILPSSQPKFPLDLNAPCTHSSVFSPKQMSPPLPFILTKPKPVETLKFCPGHCPSWKTATNNF